ncbi:MAG: LPD28 domain-containing protein [Oscillospiraceae bacterium]
MLINAMEESFDILELFGRKVLFTCMRVDRKTVPDGLFAYDVRDDDDCSGEICQIKPFVMVNHWGTIITDRPIDMDDFWGCCFVSENDYCYTGDSCRLYDFFNEKASQK